MSRRIIIVGGTGRIGAQALRSLRAEDDTLEISVVAQDDERAQKIAAEFSATALLADVRDTRAMTSLLCPGDVVLNASAPFFALEDCLLRAAIKSGAHYFDVCDDWQATEQMLRLDPDAREAGVTAVTGIGVAPGLTNMLALIAMRMLEQVDAIYTIWSIPPISADQTAPDKPDRGAVHFAKCISGRIKSLSGGQLTDTAPLQPIDLLLPAGKVLRAYTVGSPEVITLHRFAPEARTGASLMLISEAEASGLKTIGGLIDRGGLTLDTAAGLLTQATAAEPQTPTAAPTIMAVARGRHEGKERTVVAKLIRQLAVGNYLSAGVVLAQMPALLDTVNAGRPGVYSIEEWLTPEAYFESLGAAFGLQAPDLANLVEVSVA